jgi:hypothetical protein
MTHEELLTIRVGTSLGRFRVAFGYDTHRAATEHLRRHDSRYTNNDLTLAHVSSFNIKVYSSHLHLYDRPMTFVTDPF